jgi:hypothetical protein
MIHAYNEEDRRENKFCARILKVNVDPWPTTTDTHTILSLFTVLHQRFYTCHVLLFKPVQILPPLGNCNKENQISALCN